MTKELCTPAEASVPRDEPADADEAPTTVRELMQIVSGRVGEAGGTIAKLEAAVVELASILNTKISPPEDERDLGE